MGEPRTVWALLEGFVIQENVFLRQPSVSGYGYLYDKYSNHGARF